MLLIKYDLLGLIKSSFRSNQPYFYYKIKWCTKYFESIQSAYSDLGFFRWAPCLFFLTTQPGLRPLGFPVGTYAGLGLSPAGRPLGFPVGTYGPLGFLLAGRPLGWPVETFSLSLFPMVLWFVDTFPCFLCECCRPTAAQVYSAWNTNMAARSGQNSGGKQTHTYLASGTLQNRGIEYFTKYFGKCSITMNSIHIFSRVH